MSTARDKAILNSILNPFLPTEDFDKENDSIEHQDDVVDLTKEIVEAKQMEKDAIVLAESGNLKEAIEIFGRAIKIAPQLPSLYNNRAQAHRLMEDTESALADLNLAISISKGRGRSARQAFCQRALIRKKNGQIEGATEDFKNAARLGSSFAKMVMVQANPYAALCNDMLSQIMEKLVTAQ